MDTPKPTYSVKTWDPIKGRFTEQIGVPGTGLTVGKLKTALKALRRLGYSCYRADPSVLVERENPES